MRIVHWDEMFHPMFGYQINIIPKYQAKAGHEVIILTGEKPDEHPTFKGLSKCNIEEKDREYEKTYNVKIVRLPIYRVISGMVMYKPGFLKEIKKLKPDVIMCHTNDTVSSMLVALSYKYLKTPIVFDNHMLAMASVNPFSKFFRWFFRHTVTPLITKNNWKVIRTQDDPFVEEAYKIPLEQAPFISFGSDLTLFHPDNDTRKTFRSEFEIGENDFVIVYTGKIGEAKGGKLLAEAVRKKFNSVKKVTVVVVGSARGAYEEEVESIFKESENRIIRFPTQNYVDLAKFYQMADLFVCPKQCSLSFYDAQACGLPIVAENNNVNVERVSHGNGYSFVAGNLQDFIAKLEVCINMPEKEYEQMKKASLKFIEDNYNYESISAQYTDYLEKEIENFTITNGYRIKQ